MNEYRMASSVIMAEVSEGRTRDRPKLVWSVKVASAAEGRRWKQRDNVRQIGMSGES